MRTELLRRASALVPALKERALETERMRRIPQATVDDIVASGLVRLGVPDRFGGPGVDYDLAYDVAAELCRAGGADGACCSPWA